MTYHITKTPDLRKDFRLEISKLHREIRLLQSFIIGIVGKDKEGRYKPKFVKKILKTLTEEPKYTFKDKKSFLKQISKIV